MPFEVSQETRDSGQVVVSLSGTMTAGRQLQELEWTVEGMVKNQQLDVIFDLSKLTYVDSSGIGILMGCNSLLKNAGGSLRFAGVTDKVESIFKMTGIDGILQRA